MHSAIIRVGASENWTAYVTMLQSHSDRAKAGGNVLGDGINLVERTSAGSEGTRDLVDEADAGQTSSRGSVGRGAWSKDAPPADDFSLLTANGDVVADDHELDAI